MSSPLRIAVADDNHEMQEYLRKTLPVLGHEVTCVASTGRELVEHCRKQRPDLVISDIMMPDMDGIEAAKEINTWPDPIPVILLSGVSDEGTIHRAEDYIAAYLIKPVQRPNLEAAIAVVMRRFEQFQDLRKEAGDLRQALEDRKVIERAKGILMKKTQMSEADAFRRMQKLARDKNRKLVDVANMILTVEEAMGSE